jgi:hypothetical protein
VSYDARYSNGMKDVGFARLTPNPHVSLVGEMKRLADHFHTILINFTNAAAEHLFKMLVNHILLFLY